MRKKIIKSMVLGLTILCLGASVISGININITHVKSNTSVGMTPNWYERFDTYIDGQFLDGSSEDGGWKGWNNDPTCGATVTDDYYRSAPHSVEVVGSSDIVHEFTGYTEGVWNLSAWIYIPDNYTGMSNFVLFSVYYDYAIDYRIAVLLCINSIDGIFESQWQDHYLTLISRRWVKILNVIDLDNDLVNIYYDGQLLDVRKWTAEPELLMGGVLDISAVDLWADGATAIYYDDISIVRYGTEMEPDLIATGNLNWVDVNPGETSNGNFIIANGGAEGSFLDWSVESWPNWGDWTFTPSSGDDLTGSINLQVSVVAPNEQEQKYSGEVKIINKENSDDFAIIQASLATPKNKPYINTPFFCFLENHPHMFPILRKLLELK